MSAVLCMDIGLCLETQVETLSLGRQRQAERLEIPYLLVSEWQTKPGAFSGEPGRAQSLSSRGHWASALLGIALLLLFCECSWLLLKFRALRCSTEVYECLKTALWSPK